MKERENDSLKKSPPKDTGEKKIHRVGRKEPKKKLNVNNWEEWADEFVEDDYDIKRR